MSSRLQRLEEGCKEVGLFVASHTTGNKKRTYKFFDKPSAYYGPESPIFSCVGLGQAEIYIRGAKMGRALKEKQTEEAMDRMEKTNKEILDA